MPSSRPTSPGRPTAPHRRASRVGRWAAALGAAVAVAGCAGPNTAKFGNKYGVKPSPRVVAEGDPIPKGGGRAMIGKPYVVADRTYVPHEGKGYVREGWSSWYGADFHGRLTANGEVFDRQSIAAAHPTLPLPSYVRVVNTENKRSLVVRVNDRGPYEKDRVIDLSERAADALGFHRRGTTRVRVEYLGKASVAGSDDAKLLATLRLHGSPAPFGAGRGGTMLADLRGSVPESPATARALPAPEEVSPDAVPTIAARSRPVTEERVRLAGSPSAISTPDDAAAPEAPSRPLPMAVHVDTLPPQRPSLTGIY